MPHMQVQNQSACEFRSMISSNISRIASIPSLLCILCLPWPLPQESLRCLALSQQAARCSIHHPHLRHLLEGVLEVSVWNQTSPTTPASLMSPAAKDMSQCFLSGQSSDLEWASIKIPEHQQLVFPSSHINATWYPFMALKAASAQTRSWNWTKPQALPAGIRT
mmetsp:Transcript_10987/g.17264  ORF Transcript_10987/g.17264 Transcript_10987/m.17264 type:complete len:164 (-) Transcript_10987:641-1132(-)